MFPSHNQNLESPFSNQNLHLPDPGLRHSFLSRHLLPVPTQFSQLPSIQQLLNQNSVDQYSVQLPSFESSFPMNRPSLEGRANYIPPSHSFNQTQVSAVHTAVGQPYSPFNANNFQERQPSQLMPMPAYQLNQVTYVPQVTYVQPSVNAYQLNSLAGQEPLMPPPPREQVKELSDYQKQELGQHLLIYVKNNMRQRNYHQALQYLKDVIGLMPNDFNAAHLLSVCQLKLKNYEQAIQYSEKALASLGILKFKSMLILGVSHLKLGNSEQAEKYLKQAYPDSQTNINNPYQWSVNLLLGSLSKAKQQLEAAFAYYRQIANLNPANEFDAWLGLASLDLEPIETEHMCIATHEKFTHQGIFVQVYAFLKKVLAKFPDFDEAHIRMARLQLAFGNKPLAYEHYKAIQSTSTYYAESQKSILLCS